MISLHRLEGGPRDGEVTESVPHDYVIVNTEVFDEPSQDQADIMFESHRYVARWRGDEVVYLTVGPEYEDGELVRRADAPNDAFRAAIDMDGADVGGRPGVKYEVWAVER